MGKATRAAIARAYEIGRGGGKGEGGAREGCEGGGEGRGRGGWLNGISAGALSLLQKSLLYSLWMLYKCQVNSS
jgi:hypothetical protein